MELEDDTLEAGVLRRRYGNIVERQPRSIRELQRLRKLPKGQKFKLAEELWRAAVDDTRLVSAEDQALLDSRWKAYRPGKVKRISLESLSAVLRASKELAGRVSAVR